MRGDQTSLTDTIPPVVSGFEGKPYYRTQGGYHRPGCGDISFVKVVKKINFLGGQAFLPVCGIVRTTDYADYTDFADNNPVVGVAPDPDNWCENVESISFAVDSPPRKGVTKIARGDNPWDRDIENATTREGSNILASGVRSPLR